MTPEELRAAIPPTNEVAYFNTGASGPSPRPVVDAIREFAVHHAYESPGGEGMYEAGRRAEAAAREAVGRLLGTDADHVALAQSTTEAISLVATSLDWRSGDVVVRTDAEHPSGVVPWHRLADTRGVAVRVVEGDDGRFDPADFADAVDGARLVCLSAVTWNYGTRLPVADIVEVAHDAGALVLLDAAQVTGQLPVDVEALGVDFLAGAGHKWLLGPWGAGYLYLRDSARRELEPLRTGPGGVEDGTAERPALVDSARMFDLTTSPVAVYAGLVAAVQTIEEVGLDAVQSRIETLTDRLKAGLSDDRLLSPRSYETGLVSFTVDDPETFVERCAAADVVVRSIPEPACVRASVHAFNDESDVDRLLEHV